MCGDTGDREWSCEGYSGDEVHAGGAIGKYRGRITSKGQNALERLVDTWVSCRYRKATSISNRELKEQ